MKFEEMLAKQKKSNIDTFVNAGKKEESSNRPDERFWKPTLDKAGNSIALVRFLPAPDSEIPWVKYYSHGFKGDSGKWFIENCPTSIGQKCPACEANSQLWNSGLESDKEVARKRKRRTHYVSNILVLRDKGNPDNDGKVFLYKFGAKIFSKLMESMQPEFDDDEPINPFNLFDGANFKLKVKQVEGYWNYDSSEFESSSALFDGDEDRLKDVFEKMHPITTFVSPGEYSTYDELQTKLNGVLGIPEPQQMRSEPSSMETAKTVESSASNTADEGEEDDDMDYFKKLAESV